MNSPSTTMLGTRSTAERDSATQREPSSRVDCGAGNWRQSCGKVCRISISSPSMPTGIVAHFTAAKIRVSSVCTSTSNDARERLSAVYTTATPGPFQRPGFWAAPRPSNAPSRRDCLQMRQAVIRRKFRAPNGRAPSLLPARLARWQSFATASGRRAPAAGASAIREHTRRSQVPMPQAR